MKKNLNVLLKPSSSSCNMNCNYCFYQKISEERKQKNYGFMSLENLEKIVKKTFEFSNGGDCTFGFQGGEPTLVGLDFYKFFLSYIKKYNLKDSKYSLFIQTNGLKLDNEWCKFFKENNFLVGLSIDGTKEINDTRRFLGDGTGTYEKIMETKELLDFYNIEYNILTVVDNLVAENIVEIYEHYKNLNFSYLQFIPCLDPYKSNRSNDAQFLDNKHYFEFLKTLFDLWFHDYQNGKIVSIKYFEDILSNILKLPSHSCDMLGRCSIQNVIEADGTVYPCDFFAYEEWALGNIAINSFEEIIFNNKSKKFIQESLLTSNKCKFCRWHSICRNGCKRYKYREKENVFCEAISKFLDYSIDSFVIIAKSLVNK